MPLNFGKTNLDSFQGARQLNIPQELQAKFSIVNHIWIHI